MVGRSVAVRWFTLALLVSAEFVIFLDIAIVNVALPSIVDDLGLGPAALSLVVDAYQVVFGGLLLLGGRVADTVGRRQIFLVGFGVFTAASLLAGLSTSATMLVVARGLQGLGAALVVPATTALLIAVFSDEAERAKAFGIWGAMRAGGASLGGAGGGLITSLFGWQWTFLINVPIGVVVIVLGPRLLPALQRDPLARPSVLGASTGTLGLLLLSVAVVAGPHSDWRRPEVVITTVAGLALLALFVAVEIRSSNPLVPSRVLKRPVISATTASFFYGASHIPFFLLLSFYLQDSLEMNAFTAGLAMLPIGVTVMFSSSLIIPKVLRRYGARNTLIAGLTMLTVALLALSLVTPSAGYAFVLPGGLLAAFGLSCCFAGVVLPAVENVGDEDSGIVSGMVNSAQRIGSGAGVAVVLALPVFGPSPQSGSLIGAAVFAIFGLIAASYIPRRASANTPKADPSVDEAGVEFDTPR